MVWRWENTPSLYDEIPVAGSAGHRLLRIVETNPSDEVSGCILDLFNKKKTSEEWMFMVHLKSKELDCWQQLDNVRYFTGGKDFIYYSGTTRTGLIDQDGVLAHGITYADAHEKYHRAELLDASGALLKNTFNEVWNYYSKFCRKRLFEWNQHILHAWIDVGRPEQESLLTSFAPVKKDILDIHARHDPGVRILTDELDNFLKNHSLNSQNDLHEFNQTTLRLLDTLPEPIYG